MFDDWERCLKGSSYMHWHYVKKNRKKIENKEKQKILKRDGA